jgi:alkyl sulfatase BDS1-like metallo-beta-lactamase superfamily hydrolase
MESVIHWDDVPSHWSPAPLADQARTVVELAGGIGPLAARARSLAATDLPLACHLADWAWYADSGDPEAQQLVLEVYRRRILDPAANTQEILVYLDHMAAAHAAATSPG